MGRLRLVLAATAFASLLLPGPAASGGPGESRGLIYHCRLIATEREADITLIFRLRTNTPGSDWRIRLFHERQRIYRKVRTANSLGDVKVRRVVPNLAGRDDFDGRARELESRTLCEVDSRV